MANNNCNENNINPSELDELIKRAKEQPPSGSKDLDIASITANITLKLTETSEKEYIRLVKRICDTAQEQLKSQQKDKLDRKKKLLIFISIFLIIQYIVLLIFILFNGLDSKCFKFSISDDLLKTYIISVFAETLAGLIAIIKFSFDSTQETEILKILGNIVARYKKYNAEKEEKGKSNEEN